MLTFLNNDYECTGCGACFAVCQKGCIHLIQDKEGFLYPFKDEDACINCGLCIKVCPSMHRNLVKELQIKQRAYAGITKDHSIWRKSSSGGAFYEICRAWADDNTVISGAAWNGMQVRHICVKGLLGISPLHKSKYISSDASVAFKELISHIKHGKRVLFCGTPCQVAGFKSIIESLNLNREQVLLVDIVCHGVGSPLVFMECIKKIERELGVHINSYEFRAKKNTYDKNHIQKIVTDSGSIMLDTDPYIQLFLNQMCLRPSCGHNCQYRNSNRVGDITISDFKCLDRVFPKLAGERYNYSSVIINTDLGKQVLDKLGTGMRLYECSTDDISKYNPLFSRQTPDASERTQFFKEFVADRQRTIENYVGQTVIYRTPIKKVIWNLIPRFVKVYLCRRACR